MKIELKWINGMTGSTNTIAYWSGSSSLSFLNTSTYPSLTELSYVKGVTSAVQGQLDGKVGGSLTSGRVPYASAATTLTDNAGLTFSTGAGLVGNETGATDIDFRWESDIKSHMLFLDASLDQVNIGYTSAPIASGRSLNVYQGLKVSDPTDFGLGMELNSDGISIYNADTNSNYSTGYVYSNDPTSGRFFDITFHYGFRIQNELGQASIFNANYFNMSLTAGASGYGLRNNSGTVQFKNSGGAWADLISAANISDTAYDSSWNGVTTTAPSKNSVYDKLEAVIETIPVTVNASDSSTASTSLVDVTGLTVSLVAGTYSFEAQVHGQSSTTAGMKFGVNYTGTTTSIEASFSGQLATTTWAATARITALNTGSTTVGTTASAEIKNFITGKIVVSDAGTFSIRILKVTSGTAFYRSSSFLTIKKI